MQMYAVLADKAVLRVDMNAKFASYTALQERDHGDVFEFQNNCPKR
jgi:hypothetical protein